MTRPPSGTVTFLFTDIQGSTKLWQANPREMKHAVARHDVLIKGIVEVNHGVVFKTVGDAVCAAFNTALDGLSAAVASQLALKAEPWPLPSPILVRMALHTGEAEERDADYFGPALNRVARLLSIGHGGQTVLDRGREPREFILRQGPSHCKGEPEGLLDRIEINGGNPRIPDQQ